jgi:hypothetical protein
LGKLPNRLLTGTEETFLSKIRTRMFLSFPDPDLLFRSVRMQGSETASGSVPKCHGSSTLIKNYSLGDSLREYYFNVYYPGEYLLKLICAMFSPDPGNASESRDCKEVQIRTDPVLDPQSYVKGCVLFQMQRRH